MSYEELMVKVDAEPEWEEQYEMELPMRVFVYYNLHKKCWSIKALSGKRID